MLTRHPLREQKPAKLEIEVPKRKTGEGRVLYPDSAEREYQRVINAYMEIIHKVVMKYRPKIVEAYKEELAEDARFDSYSGFWVKWSNYYDDMMQEITKKTSRYNAKKQIERISRLARRSSFRQWQKMVKKTLGIDVDENFYKGAQYQNIAEAWVQNNVDMIKTVPNNVLRGMNKQILDAYQNGLTAKELEKAITHTYGVEKGRAKFWARDQLSTLNSQITQKQHEDAGVTKYKWSTSRDSRVRDCHASFNGRIFEYANPPEIWQSTAHGRKYTGRHCNPGEDYMCRCVAIPVFDKGMFNFPVNP